MKKLKQDLEEKICRTEISTSGRIKKIRKHKEISFLILEQAKGELIQCVLKNDKFNLPPVESIIEIYGNLTKVEKGQFEKEILVSDICTISPVTKQLDFDINNPPKSRKSRIEKQHLNLRNPEVIKIFEEKSRVLQDTRNFFYKHNYIEINSPSIVGESVEGNAESFKFKYFGKNANLSISNMLYHNILISGNLEKIFELGSLFRQDKSNTSTHLSEFTILDVSQAYAKREDLMLLIEQYVKEVGQLINERGNFKAPMTLDSEFPVFTYKEIVKYLKKEGHDVSDHKNLGKSYSKSLEKLCPNFFWIIDQPEKNKSFFTKSRYDEDNEHVCNDFQLWYPKITDVADGSERVTNHDVALKKMLSRGLNPNNFEAYLNSLAHGTPPLSGIGLGFNILYMLLIGKDNVRDVVLFPRDNNYLYP